MTKPTFQSLFFVIWVAVFASQPLYAASCGPITLDNITLDINDRELRALVSGKVTARHELPVIGSGWRCLKTRLFPKHRLLFIEWHGGEAGTFQMFHRISLLAFSVKPGKLKLLKSWPINQGYRGREPDITEADITYRFEVRDYGINVVMEGFRRITVEPQ